jgi:AGCS family alanine or glycine:cation symporter
MKFIQRYCILLFMLMLPLLATAQPAADSTAAKTLTIDEKIDQAFRPVADQISNVVFYSIPLNDVKVPIVLIVLLFGALFCTIYFGFPNITKIGLAIRTIGGRYTVKKNGDAVEAGEVSHFQALTTALSATVGLGNIAGVAIALSIGGPGATFWMIVAGFLGMASKFAECTLGVKYREIDSSGVVHGGPMYYMRTGFAERGIGGVGKFFAAFFALMCVGGSFGGGNMFQSNQAAQQVMATFGGGADGGPTSGGFIFGIICAALVAIIIVGGVQRIAQVTDKLVPFMAILYVGMGIVILIVKFSDIPTAFQLIFSRAFEPEAIGGGVIGAMIAGFQRAAFSNEAGVGSAAIAHSAVKTNYPASEGVVALLEPFIDTVIICTMSALVIVVTNIDGGFLTYGTKAVDGVGITSTAFDSVIPGSSYILTVVIVLFAFSTMISWSYYGLQAWKYLFGKSKVSDISYKIIFCCFTVIGASASLGAVIDFSDAMIFAMVFPNMIALIVLAPVIKAELAKYINHTKQIEKEIAEEVK